MIGRTITNYHIVEKLGRESSRRQYGLNFISRLSPTNRKALSDKCKFLSGSKLRASKSG